MRGCPARCRRAFGVLFRGLITVSESRGLVIKISDLAVLFSTTSLETRGGFFVVFFLPCDGGDYALSGDG